MGGSQYALCFLAGGGGGGGCPYKSDADVGRPLPVSYDV